MDEPLVEHQGTGTSDRTFLIADERGSIVAGTNSSGAKTYINRYDEYGKPQSGNQGRFQYTGQVYLSDAKLYHYKARIYDPDLGRFLQTDPIGYVASMNLFAYVGNDPMNFNDPYGLEEDDWNHDYIPWITFAPQGLFSSDPIRLIGAPQVSQLDSQYNQAVADTSVTASLDSTATVSAAIAFGAPAVDGTVGMTSKNRIRFYANNWRGNQHMRFMLQTHGRLVGQILGPLSSAVSGAAATDKLRSAQSSDEVVEGVFDLSVAASTLRFAGPHGLGASIGIQYNEEIGVVMLGTALLIGPEIEMKSPYSAGRGIDAGTAFRNKPEPVRIR